MVPLLATASSDKTVRLWRLDGHCVRVLRGHTEWAYCCAFSPAGDHLCSGTGPLGPSTPSTPSTFSPARHPPIPTTLKPYILNPKPLCLNTKP